MVYTLVYPNIVLLQAFGIECLSSCVVVMKRVTRFLLLTYFLGSSVHVSTTR